MEIYPLCMTELQFFWRFFVLEFISFFMGSEVWVIIRKLFLPFVAERIETEKIIYNWLL